MAKLPSVYANPINKKINNVQETYYGREERNIDVNPSNITNKINAIFSAKEVIVGKTNLNLLTMDGKLIRITEIVDIEKI